MDVHAHIAAFNAAVTSGDWEPFVARFAVDARLAFVGPPVGPFVGREAIRAAYQANPPDDTIDLVSPSRTDGAVTTIPFRWQRTGATGAMRITEADGEIGDLTVSFD